MKFKVLLCLLIFTSSLFAQSDWRIAKYTTPLDQVERINLPTQDNEQLLQQELNRRSPDTAPRFAVTLPVNITPETHGTWEYTESGKAVWRLRIHSKDAKSLNLGFTKYVMPPGGLLVIYSLDKQTVIGPFSPADNEDHEELWTPVFPADELIVEVQLPAQMQSALQLELKTVNHDFIGFGSVVSGSCNVDVVCGAADGYPIIEKYRDIIQSVAVYGFNGNTFCTGFLVSNTRGDCTPYFMTANHCDVDPGEAPSVVAYWNFENSTCRAPGSTASGQNGNGQFNDFNTGAVLRASYAPSDMALLEFDDPISETANAFLAGWNTAFEMPQDTIIGIHHPSTEEKRISFEFDPAQPGNGLNSNIVDISNASHIIIPDWDIGTTEPGSSGSPIFNNQKQVVGQLHGGGAACGNDFYDTYGWFRTSWTGGGNSNNRLSDWLDPDNTGVTAIDGVEASFCEFSLQASNQAICLGANEAVFALVPTLNFIGEVEIEVSGLPMGIDYTLSTNPVAPGDTTYLTLTNVNTLMLDNYIINVNVTDGTNSRLNVLALSVILPPEITTLNTPANGATDINLTASLNWQAITNTENYRLQIATDIDFMNIVRETSTSATTFNASGLENNTTYYWRIFTSNSCEDVSSEVYSFTTILDLGIAATNPSVAICNSETASFSLVLGSDFETTGATFSVSNLPMGATATFSPNPVLPNEATTLTVENLQDAIADNYVLSINADDGTNSTNRGLVINLDTPPLPVAMNAPMDAAVEVDLSPQFIWIPTDGADDYTLEIATDQDFTTIVGTTTTNITVYSIPEADELEDSKLHYWRVIAKGECGDTPSEVRTFTTIIIDEVVELNNTKIDIRPNPTKGLVNISLSQSLPDDLTVEIYGVNGQRLIRQIETGATQIEVSLENYPTGIYMLRLINAQHVLTRKVILQH